MAEAWIVANRAGLANTLSELERRRILEEVIQNALDTDAKNIIVTLTKPKRGYSTLTVEDDDPIGFVDLSLAYEMFADTPKRSDPTKAGRFTIGEKRVLALSKEASIESTKGTVVFEIVNGKEQRKVFARRCREKGTLAKFEIQMNDEQYENACAGVKAIIPNDSVRLVFNGEMVCHRKPFRTFKATLQTELADADRKMVKRDRQTEIRLFKPQAGEVPSLYEMSIPVVEVDCAWHISIMQRIPLNSDRDNVTPKYKQTVLALSLNEAYDKLTEDEAVSPWVKEARSSDLITKDAFESTNKQIWGENAVIPDPSDPESINRAVSEGYSVVRGATKEEYENNRRFGVVPTSSSVFPTPRPYSPGGPIAKCVDEKDWTPGMRMIHAYCVGLGKELLGAKLSVRFVKAFPNPFIACFGKDSAPTGPQMDFNYARLGKKWFDQGITPKLDALIIHEFGHYYESNHLDEKYYDALCDLGARLKVLALTNPAFFKPFN